MSQENSDQVAFMGRIVKLQNIVSRPELNGAFATVQSFDSSKGRFGVQLISKQFEPRETIGLKPDALIVVHQSTFDEKYPTAVKREVGFIYDVPHEGSFYQLSHRFQMPSQLILSHSCKLCGVFQKLDEKGVCTPVTCLSYSVVIMAASDSVFEIEDINFDAQEPNAAYCGPNATVLFRRCRFKSTNAAVAVAGDNKITFENCLFEDCPGNGAIVANNASAHFFGCTFRRVTSGVEVRQSGNATIDMSRVTNVRHQAVMVYSHGLRAVVRNSYIADCGDSGVIIQAAALEMHNCDIENCKMAGIAVEGPKSTAVISAVRVSDTLHGLLTQVGYCDVTAKDCSFMKQKMYGVFVGRDCTGRVSLSGLSFAGNVRSIEHDGGSNCVVTLDGKRQAANGATARASHIAPEFVKNVYEKAMKTSSSVAGQRPQLDTRRARKAAGVDVMLCDGCGTEEPEGVKFLKCAKCLEACYCERRCQVAAWKEHKKTCVPRVKYPQLLDPNESI